jgi:hypothetical protein
LSDATATVASMMSPASGALRRLFASPLGDRASDQVGRRCDDDLDEPVDQLPVVRGLGLPPSGESSRIVSSVK